MVARLGREDAVAGLVALIIAYIFSQFYRAFLAVLAPALSADLGASAADLSTAAGLWFLVFAGLQVPIGVALDRFGARSTVSALFLAGAVGGALVLASAQQVWHVWLAMSLIGAGCAPVLMGTYLIFTRRFSPAVFATLAGAMVGFGTLGNLIGSVPLAYAVETFGWRETITGLAAVSGVIGLFVAALLRDPPAPPPLEGEEGHGSLLDLLRSPGFLLLLPLMLVNYAPSAGIRGLWAGPYLSEVYGMTAAGIGQMMLFMGLAMAAGNLAYGASDRLFERRNTLIFWGNIVGALACLVLWMNPMPGLWTLGLLLVVVGFFGGSFAQILAHGRDFIPPRLIGRGLSLMNMFAIGGVGLMQVVTSAIYDSSAPAAVAPTEPYAAIFLFYAVALGLGCLIYLRAPISPPATAGR